MFPHTDINIHAGNPSIPHAKGGKRGAMDEIKLGSGGKHADSHMLMVKFRCYGKGLEIHRVVRLFCFYAFCFLMLVRVSMYGCRCMVHDFSCLLLIA